MARAVNGFFLHTDALIHAQCKPYLPLPIAANAGLDTYAVYCRWSYAVSWLHINQPRCVQVVALTLMTVAVYTKAITYITVLPAVGAGFTCGVFLLFVSIVGIFGITQHNQAILFFVSFGNTLYIYVYFSTKVAQKSITNRKIKVTGQGQEVCTSTYSRN